MVLIIISVIYFLIRIILIILPILKRKSIKWYIKCSRLITSIFLSRFKKDKEEEYLNSINQQIHNQIDQNEISIQFDDDHFSYKSRMIDFIITLFISIIFLIIIIIGWDKILNKAFSGQQLEDVSFLCTFITYALFIGICIRIVINIIWLIRTKQELIFLIFNKLKYLAYKALNFLSTILILPILKIAQNSSSTVILFAKENEFFDTRPNTDSFIRYFLNRDINPIVNCTNASIINVLRCKEQCSKIDVESFLYDSLSVYYDEIECIYLSGLIFIYMYFASIYILLFRYIYCIDLDIITNLPSPTKNIECKFQTIINEIDSAPITAFRSYKYKNALYSFSFIGTKVIIIFWLTKFTFDRKDIIDLNELFYFCVFFFPFSLAIFAESQLFSSPYISILHNIVNFLLYGSAAIFNTLISLHLSFILNISKQKGDIFIVCIVIIPIVTALITPFFAKKDPLLALTKFDLVKIQKWDKKLNKLLKFKHNKSKIINKRKKKNKNNKNDNENNDDYDEDFNVDGILFDEEPSFSISYYQNDNEKEREHDTIIGQFDLLKLAPIKIQEQLNNKKINKDGNVDQDYLNFKNEVRETWCKIDILENDFEYAKNEMLFASKKLIDCVSYNNLIRLFNFSIIFSSAILGCIFGFGIIRWHQITGPNSSMYYLRCNMFPNGTYPAFGTY